MKITRTPSLFLASLLVYGDPAAKRSEIWLGAHDGCQQSELEAATAGNYAACVIGDEGLEPGFEVYEGL